MKKHKQIRSHLWVTIEFVLYHKLMLKIGYPQQREIDDRLRRKISNNLSDMTLYTLEYASTYDNDTF